MYMSAISSKRSYFEDIHPIFPVECFNGDKFKAAINLSIFNINLNWNNPLL